MSFEDSHEGFLTPDDFKTIGQEVSNEEIEKINNKPSGDSEREDHKDDDTKHYQEEETNSLGEESIIHTKEGIPIFPNTDVEEIYPNKSLEEIKKEIEKEETKDRERELRKVQWNVVSEITKKGYGNRKHIYFIKKGSRILSPISTKDQDPKKFFMGSINVDTIAVKDENGNLNLMKFFGDQDLKVEYHDKNKGKNVQILIENKTTRASDGKEKLQIEYDHLVKKTECGYIDLHGARDFNSFLNLLEKR